MFLLKNLRFYTFYLNQLRTKSSYTKVQQLTKERIGENVKIKGWIKGHRKMKENVFLDVNDGSCCANIQVVIHKELIPNTNFGASIEASGILSETPKGQLEIKADDYKPIGKCPITENYPFTPKQTYPPEYIRQFLHLRSRVSPFNSMLRVRHNAIHAINNYLNKAGYIQIQTPIMTSNDCEGAGEVFRVQPENNALLRNMKKKEIDVENAFFDKKTFLTVSGQLHLEAMSHGLGDVYTFGPTFRAENSKSPLHLSEFYMLEVEQAFVSSINDVCTFLEDMTKTITNEIINNSEKDILNARPKDNSKNLQEIFHWTNKPFPIITFEEALGILNANKSSFKISINEKDGLAKEHELFLVQYYSSPLFVIDWPRTMKPFYMRRNKNNPDLVEAVDFLAPFVGELAGGSVREDNYDELKSNLPNDLNWYLELRKFGGITTGGFGLGFERYLQILLGAGNIRDTIPFPRWAHNCDM